MMRMMMMMTQSYLMKDIGEYQNDIEHRHYDDVEDNDDGKKMIVMTKLNAVGEILTLS